MPHVLERAATGRARCRACATAIARDSFRIGEAVPNLYADTEGAESVHWYHPRCAALRRPEAFLEAVATSAASLPDAADLVAAAELGVRCHRLPRLDKAGLAPSGRAACRACRAAIPKGTWRLELLFWQDGRFAPAGFIHVACAGAYFGTAAVLDRIRHFTPDLDDGDAALLAELLGDAP